MKISKMLDVNPVRQLFLSYFEDVKKIVEEIVDEEQIQEACKEAEMPIVSEVSFVPRDFECKPIISLGTDVSWIEDNKDCCEWFDHSIDVPENTWTMLKEKYESKFKALNLEEFPMITFYLFKGIVSVEIGWDIYKNVKEPQSIENFFINYFSDMRIEEYEFFDEKGKLFTF